MRIIAGNLKGRALKLSKENNCRPTTSAVKEAVFSILASGSFIDKETGESVLEGAVTVEPFGGTGAMTFEAISRGASKGVIIEQDPSHMKDIEANAKKFGLKNSLDLIRGDATKLSGTYSNKFNIAFIDPPFNKQLIEPSVLELTNKGWLAPKALLVIESHEREDYKLDESNELLVSKKYGKTLLKIYRQGN